jgi:hypothetical protein
MILTKMAPVLGPLSSTGLVVVVAQTFVDLNLLLLCLSDISSFNSWFDMWGLAELSCHLCPPDDDDRRFLSKADDDARSAFQTTLCDRLRDGSFVDMREGSFVDMRDIEDCRVVYVAR